MNRLESLKAKNAERTEGPWQPGTKWRTIIGEHRQDIRDARMREVGHSWFSEPDAAFIAAAANAMEDLLAAVEAARETADSLEESTVFCSVSQDCLTDQRCKFCKLAVALRAVLSPLLAEEAP